MLKVRSGSSGGAAGLRKEDIIESVNGRRCKNTGDFKSAISQVLRWGAQIPCTVRRGYSR